MVVRRVQAHEWEQLRDIRFCITLEEVSRVTRPIWEERARMGAESAAIYLGHEARGRGVAKALYTP
ncbi:MAG: hypothetical protein KF760_28210 [Candidatus Eremiobacteraeota bacterium]|nr:hypothetical protein [Candidatus Eremiobacteraeota bacterium]MCW5865780.1 hypothetical protein [Candidatus Eremiobacteraeota bacterium]